MRNIERNYWLLLPVLGIVCILAPGKVARWLPSILGSIMILTSITDMIFLVKEKKYLVDYKNRASSLILFIMGICFLLGQESTVFIMGITWGILGLQEVNEELEKILMKKSRKEKWKREALFAGIKLVLSLALIFEPAEKFEFHISLLGLEILAVTINEEKIAAFIDGRNKRHDYRGE